ncbi:unnamed protein product [Ilex paraguariensis]|uniref:Probable glutathione S-transferase n=1 Tax=Ilex paraguariensis TaxID=185542 RepID=A0ABC8R0Y3_9AQUA
MAEEEVKLIGVKGSPINRRVETALKMKGVQYEFIAEDLSNKSPLLLKYNLVHKKIHVLLHNGKPICESLVILEYIDETWKGTPILPKDPYERIKARFWANLSTFHIPKTKICNWFVQCLPVFWKCCWSQGEEQEKAKEEASELLKILDNELKDKKFFGGDNIGLADIAANFISHWFPITQEVTGVEVLTKEKYPTLCEWINEFVNCSIMKENLHPKTELVAFFPPSCYCF